MTHHNQNQYQFAMILKIISLWENKQFCFIDKRALAINADCNRRNYHKLHWYEAHCTIDSVILLSWLCLESLAISFCARGNVSPITGSPPARCWYNTVGQVNHSLQTVQPASEISPSKKTYKRRAANVCILQSGRYLELHST